MNPAAWRSRAVSWTASRTRLAAFGFLPMTNLLQRPACYKRIELLRRKRQQIARDTLQRIQFRGAHVRSLVLFETEQEEICPVPVCRHQDPRTAALAATGKSHALLDDRAAQIGIDEAAFQTGGGPTKVVVRQRRPQHPAHEVAGLEGSTQSISLSVLAGKTWL